MPEQKSRQAPPPYDEAIYSQLDENGNRLPSGALSLSEIEVVDLISEGEIEGLVTGEYPLTGVSGVAGEIGWRRYNFVPYRNAPNTTAKYLRSIYWNETPIVSSDNKYNYQRVSISKTNGTALGSLLDSTNQEVTISRQLNERLRGSVTNVDGSITDDNKDYAKYYRILNKDCRGIYLNVRFNALYAYIIGTNDEFGEASVGLQKDTAVEYNIYYRPLFSSQTPTESSFILAKKEVVRGRITQGYIKQTRIDFLGNFPDQQDFLGYEIKVIRLTPDFLNIALNQDIKNSTVIDSLTEIYNQNFVYPHSAMVRSKFTADFFSSVPARSYDVKLLKVKIPSTYDPILKTYTEPVGGWDGTFKTNKEWTDNPAWCFYDLITNKRYGLGNYIDETYVDKWSLYEIAKYCDTLVPDGYGTLEPRFTCNLIINNREEAYKVVNSMASIFRAINYYACGSIYTVQDSPKDPVYLFTNANVKDGNFNYQSSSRRVRHSVAMIRFNDKDNFFRPAVEYVENAEAIRQYGIRTVELTAYGCSSRGQANRLGKWALISENLETDTVAFGGGLECSFLRPGDLIKTFDSNRKTLRYGGRTSQITNLSGVGFTGSIITLDSNVSLPNTGSLYSFNILTPTYFYDSSQVSDITSSGYSDIRRNQIQRQTFTGKFLTGVTGLDSGIRSQITFYNMFDTGNYIVSGNLVWTIELISGQNNQSGVNTFDDSSRYIDPNYDWWRVVTVKESEAANYTVNAVQHNPNKFALVETGLYFQAPVDQPVATPTTPVNLVVASEKASRYSARVLFSAVTPNDSGITSYKIFAQQSNTGFIVGNNVPTDDYLIASLPKESSAAYYNIPSTGSFYFRAYSINDVNGRYSTGYATGMVTVTGHFPIQDVSISSLNLDDASRTHSGYRTTGSYYTLNPTFTWQVGIDSESTLGQNFTYRLSIRQPSNSNTPSSNIYFQTTGWQANSSAPSFPFSFNQNCLISGGPYRQYDVVVEAMDASGRTSAGNQIGSTESWSNPYGYDILYVNFPRLTGFQLTTGNQVGNQFQTDQWIDSEGSIALSLISGALPDTIEGGYMYANTGLFTSGHIQSGSNGVTLEMVPVDVNANFYKSAVKLSLFNTGWMAVSFYDSWDKALRDKGLLIERTLPVSNIVPVYGTGSFYNIRATNSVSIIDPSDYLSSSSYTTETVTDAGSQYVVTYVTDEEGVKKVVGSRIK